MPVSKLSACLLLTAMLAACGDSGPPGAAHNRQAIAGARRTAASQRSIGRAFLQLPGARTDSIGDIDYGSGCSVEVILASPAEVATYSGDPDVVLDPAGSLGVKVGAPDQDQAACMRQAAAVLRPLGR